MFTSTKSKVDDKEPRKEEPKKETSPSEPDAHKLVEAAPVQVVVPSLTAPIEPPKKVQAPRDVLGDIEEGSALKRKPQDTRVSEIEIKNVRLAAVFSVLRQVWIMLKKFSAQLEIISWFGLAFCMFLAGVSWKDSWKDALSYIFLAILFLNIGLRLPSSKVGASIQKAYARLTQT